MKMTRPNVIAFTLALTLLLGCAGGREIRMADQFAKAGNILVRQRGTRHHAGPNVGIGKDHTLFALIDGTVMFSKKTDNRSYVSVLPVVPVNMAENAPSVN